MDLGRVGIWQYQLDQVPSSKAKEIAAEVEEMGYGTCALAVPVHDRSGEVVAALGLVTRKLRKDIVKFAPALQVASASITRRMAV